jgi:hypothetical protein
VSRLFRVQRSVRFDVLLVVILVVGQGLCLPLTGQVVWAVTSWDDPDADDGEGIRRLRVSEVHHASGLPASMHMGPNRRIDPPGVRSSPQSRTSSRLIARAPPQRVIPRVLALPPPHFVVSRTVRFEPRLQQPGALSTRALTSAVSDANGAR